MAVKVLALAKGAAGKGSKIVGPVDGTCNWFNGTYGFFYDPDKDVDVFVHRNNLSRDNKGRLIKPLNGGKVRFSYQPSTKEGHEDDFEVAGTVEVIDRYNPAKAEAA